MSSLCVKQNVQTMPLINIDSFTTRQRTYIVQTYNENDRPAIYTFRNLRTNFGRHGPRSESSIQHINVRFEATAVQ